MWITDLSISKKLYCGIAVIVSCFIVLLAAAGVNLAKLSEANSWNVHTYEVLAEADATLEALVNVETGERGFALTGAQASLEPYDAGLAAFAAHWEKAKSLTSDNASQQARLQAIRRNKEQWVRDALEPVLNMRRGVVAGSETMDKLIAFVQAAKGKKAMDALRAEVDEFKRAEQSLLGQRSAESATLGRTMRGTLLVGGAAVTLAALALAVLMVRSILIPMRQVLRATEDLRAGEGDLTYRLPKLGAEFGELADSLNGFMQKLHDIIGDVRTSTDEIACASQQISAGNSDLSSRTELQASSLQETASSMEELTGTVRRNAENAQRANQLARSASDVAKQGGVVVSQVVQTMGAINDSAGKISDIIGVIDGIAFQTN
ncbi:MAG: CHASE3 domain-containing protein, partial [Duganella sp.]